MIYSVVCENVDPSTEWGVCKASLSGVVPAAYVGVRVILGDFSSEDFRFSECCHSRFNCFTGLSIRVRTSRES